MFRLLRTAPQTYINRLQATSRNASTRNLPFNNITDGKNLAQLSDQANKRTTPARSPVIALKIYSFKRPPQIANSTVLVNQDDILTVHKLLSEISNKDLLAIKLFATCPEIKLAPKLMKYLADNKLLNEDSSEILFTPAKIIEALVQNDYYHVHNHLLQLSEGSKKKLLAIKSFAANPEESLDPKLLTTLKETDLFDKRSNGIKKHATKIILDLVKDGGTLASNIDASLVDAKNLCNLGLPQDPAAVARGI